MIHSAYSYADRRLHVSNESSLLLKLYYKGKALGILAKDTQQRRLYVIKNETAEPQHSSVMEYPGVRQLYLEPTSFIAWRHLGESELFIASLDVAQTEGPGHSWPPLTFALFYPSSPTHRIINIHKVKTSSFAGG
jgi:hypothetical protein